MFMRAATAFGPLLFNLADGMHQCADLENQRDFTAAQNGRSANTTQVAEHHAERFDHRLELAHQRIDDDARPFAGKLHDDNIFAWRRRAFELE